MVQVAIQYHVRDWKRIGSSRIWRNELIAMRQAVDCNRHQTGSTKRMADRRFARIEIRHRALIGRQTRLNRRQFHCIVGNGAGAVRVD